MLPRTNAAILADIAFMRRLAAVLWFAGFGCGFAWADDVPLPRPRPPAPPAWTEPRSFREAAGPDFKSDQMTSALSGCNERLAKMAELALMPRLIGPGACGGEDLVEIAAVLLPDKGRVAVEPAALLSCGMAESLASWLREEAAPRIAALGRQLKKVENYDSYQCRTRNRIFGAKLSQHAHGHALDIRAFHLDDGRRFELTDITVDKTLRDGLRETACARFTTVLGPGSDGHHEGHVHFDVIGRHNGYRICQWDVREPPKPATPLPPEKPVVVAAVPAEKEAEPAAAPSPGMKIADAAVPLPPPRPARADASRNHRRKTRGGVHFPFNLFR